MTDDRTPDHIRALCERYRDLTHAAGEGQTAVAAFLGVSDRTVRAWIAGDRTPPRSAITLLEREIQALE